MAQLLGMGNPLLDISAVVPQEVLDKYKVRRRRRHPPLSPSLSGRALERFLAGLRCIDLVAANPPLSPPTPLTCTLSLSRAADI